MARFTRWVLALAIVATGSSAAFAQGRGGGMQRGVMLLSNKSVRSELKMNDEQVAKVDAMLAEMREKHSSDFEKMRDAEPQDRMRMSRELMQTMLEESKKPLAEILKPEQVKRFSQIELQTRGLDAMIADPTIGSSLKLSDDQKEKIKTIQQDSFTQMREIFQNSQGDREAAMKKMTELRKETMEKGLAVLSDEQKKAWNEAIGAPFTLVPDPRP